MTVVKIHTIYHAYLILKNYHGDHGWDGSLKNHALLYLSSSYGISYITSVNVSIQSRTWWKSCKKLFGTQIPNQELQCFTMHEAGALGVKVLKYEIMLSKSPIRRSKRSTNQFPLLCDLHP